MNQNTHHKAPSSLCSSCLCGKSRWLTVQDFNSPSLIAQIGRDQMPLNGMLREGQESVEIQPKVLRCLRGRRKNTRDDRTLSALLRRDHLRDITKMIAGGALSR
ncbi:hypothetical protein [uncultured Thiodictyon sp.]|uniref:hypothetical protein n=1 Tax=uncultured Thiodictyon sp. TaxID=1846217 RepID=UPI0025E48324|nr:hypothetical protein [uncultured Thiodictyon sp.]